MNYLPYFTENNDDPVNEEDHDDNMGVKKKWYEKVFIDKGQKLPKASKNEDKTYKDYTILQLLQVVKDRFDNNDMT